MVIRSRENYPSQTTTASDEPFYELVMQSAESWNNGSISEAIMEWKNFQTKKLIDQKIISASFAAEQLALIRDIVTNVEKWLVEILLWDDIKERGDTFYFPLTKENKQLLRVIYRGLSILYAYRNDKNIEHTKAMLEKIMNDEDDSSIILNIELPTLTRKIRRIYFTSTENKSE